VAARSRCSAPRPRRRAGAAWPTPASSCFSTPAVGSQRQRDALAICCGAAAAGDLPFDILCIEGALLRGPNGSGRFQMRSGSGRPLIDWVRAGGARRHVLAIGSCSAYGGIISPAKTSPTPAVCSSTATRRAACSASIFVRRCRPAGDQRRRLPDASRLGRRHAAGPGARRLGESDLDAWQRPRFYTEQLVHHGCPRNEYYEFKASAQKLSDLGCLMENMGCKGTQANADCNLRPWNGVGSCVRGGFACISCTEPGFEEPGHPFMETAKIAGIPTGLPIDMPKAWFVALAACPSRRRRGGCARIRAPITR
jgi:Ni,Fe-hydrogenase I small subunit